MSDLAALAVALEDEAQLVRDAIARIERDADTPRMYRDIAIKALAEELREVEARLDTINEATEWLDELEEA